MRSYVVKSTTIFASELFKAYHDNKFDDKYLIGAEEDEIEPVNFNRYIY
jgi:hypothetical protein